MSGPGCGAKRGAAFAAFLRDEVLEPVGHAMWTFSIPKLIRPLFLHHRALLGSLCHAAWETVSELMTAAVVEVDGFRTGMVVVAQTAGDALGLHPHLHAVVPRGGWTPGGGWVPVPFVDAGAAERLFRHKVLSFLKLGGLLSDERAALLLSWQHHTGLLRRCAACDLPWSAAVAVGRPSPSPARLRRACDPLGRGRCPAAGSRWTRASRSSPRTAPGWSGWPATS